MHRRTILFVMNADTPDSQVRDAAEAAAQDGHHLTCLILTLAPALPAYAYGVPPYGAITIPDTWAEMVTQAQDRQKTRETEVEALLAKSGTSGAVLSVICAAQDIKHLVARHARVSDEAFLAPGLRDTPEVMREVATGVLYHSPIGLRVNGALSLPITRVYLAWDSGAAASAAAHVALPYLKEADEVLVACIDPVMTPERDGQDPGSDIAAWLSHHGCRVTVSQFSSGGREIGACIADRAQEFGADLVVMGGFGHARMIQAVLGGTTRSMMDQTRMPVLFAHR